MKPTEMKRKKSQKKKTCYQSDKDRRYELFFFEIIGPDVLKPDICATADGWHKRQVSQNKTAQPQTPYQIRSFPLQEPGKAQSEPKSQNIRKDSDEQWFFNFLSHKGCFSELFHGFS